MRNLSLNIRIGLDQYCTVEERLMDLHETKNKSYPLQFQPLGKLPLEG